MNLRVVGILGIASALVMAVSCAFDEREIGLTFPLFGSDAGVPAGPSGPSRENPGLSVAPASIDLGWVATGFAARAPIRITNTGNTPLPVPAVRLSAGSDAAFTIIQNQCLADLLPGAACDVRVQMIPSRPGPITGGVHVESAGGLAADVSLVAEGLTAGALILAPALASSEDFGGVPLGTTVQGVFTVSNPSSTASGPLAFRSNRSEFNVQQTGAPGECVIGTTSLVNGESCNVAIAFTPTLRGPVEATFTGRSDAVGAISSTLAGRGLAPGVLAASAAELDFAGVALGEGARRGVSFTNAGDEPLTLTGASLAPPEVEGFSILGSDCSARVLMGGEACGVDLEFRPVQSGEGVTAELWAEALEGPQRQVVALRGIGLEQGQLAISPMSAGEEDFGSVLLGGSVVRSFQVTNPGAQPSGVLILTASDGFEVVTPPEPGECGDAVTSIVDGQSCSLRVRFAPTRREAYQGLLTVSSALAGAKGLTVLGAGILPAALQVAPEINFGRVFTNDQTSRTLTVANAGDEPLAAPTLEVTSTVDALAAAFSYESACAAPLAFGETCDITVRLAPTQPAPHSANLRLSSTPGGSANVLLLAEVLAPGSLVITPAQGATGDFGDVQIGTNATREFSLTNPGNVASGRISMRSDNNRFEVLEGNCNPADSPGLVDGSSCTFSVRFTPDSSVQVVANLSVQSPGAGQKGIEIRGRGRNAADLRASAGSRDLGRANIGQETLTQPENQFVWTVTNQGDLPSGVLGVANDNPTEFVTSNDGCSTATVAGGGSCNITIRFRPNTTGARAGRVVVQDAASGRTASVALTAVGQRLAQLGQACASAGTTCAAGVCTRGVCCDRQCDGSCQACSTAGVCTDQRGQEACGNGNGRCFGVNRCLLPNGQACAQGADCGNGNCEVRLGGRGASDRICCQQDCDALGQECNAQGQCQQPTLAAGATCGAAGNPPCASGLECKSCRGGGNRCSAANECCGGCDAGYTCLAGGRCGCPTGQIDCGGGLCIQSRDTACCPASAPRCSGARPNCDNSDHTCKECVNATQCAGTNRACNAGACACATGNKDCGGGRCIANNQCCETCSGGRTCQNGTCGCPNGQTFVNGQCLLPQGAACTANGTRCVTGQCVDGVCCESTCTGLCTQCQAGTGRCVAPADDRDCPPVTCTTTDTCRVPGAVANRCRAVGECKTTADCPSPGLARAGTACDQREDIGCSRQPPCFVEKLCNASGACVAPTVACNGVQSLPVSGDACCDVPSIGSSPGQREQYIASGCSINGFGSMTMFCDSQSDCAVGPVASICCLSDFSNFNSLACSTECDESIANPIEPDGPGFYRLCQSPGGGTSPCPGGRACTRRRAGLAGYLFCAL